MADSNLCRLAGDKPRRWHCAMKLRTWCVSRSRQCLTTASSTGAKPNPKTDVIFLHHLGLAEFWVGKQNQTQGRQDKETHLTRIKLRYPDALKDDVTPDSILCPCWVNDVGTVRYPGPAADWVIDRDTVQEIQLRLHHDIPGEPNPLVFRMRDSADAIFLNHNAVKTYIKPWFTRGGEPEVGLAKTEGSKQRILNPPPSKGRRIP